MQTSIVIEAGNIGIYKLIGSAGAKKLAINDNATELYQLPSLYGSLDDGTTFERLSAKFMQKLSASNNDMLLIVDASQLMQGLTYIVHSVSTDRAELCNFDSSFDSSFDISMRTNIMQQLQYGKDHFYYDASQRCYDEHDLKKVVADNLHDLSKAAQDNAAWPIKYYQAKTLTAIDVLNAYELKSITDVKDIAVFFPHRKVIGQLDFDQFGLQYDELTTIHILADEFHRVFDDVYARPGKLDIIYIAFLDQFFEISDVSDIKTPLNTILYYDCTLRVVSDRKSVAKDDDIIDLGALIDGNDQAEEYEFKDQEPESIEGDKQFYSFAERTWSFQKFDKAITYEPTDIDDAVYGIVWSVERNGWCKWKYIEGYAYIASLTSKEFSASNDTVYFAKLAAFNTALSAFDEQMYYSSPKFPRTLQPTVLYEYQTEV